MPTERKHREEIVRYGRMLHERGFVAAMDGNLSVRLDHDRILVTPTCVSKGAMRPPTWSSSTSTASRSPAAAT